jgi:alpha-aminoadipic semialdehyde synthase
MSFTLGIRREDKNQWERRAPIVPRHVRELHDDHDIKTIIQPSSIRAFQDKEYEAAGAMVQDDVSPCPVIFAVKEIPKDFFEPGKTYVFFSHTIKGQEHNMPMLAKMMELGCNLIDYEKIVDKQGRRLVFFGRYAGLAGMIDTFWAFGQRLQWENIPSSFSDIRQTISYHDLAAVTKHVATVGMRIKRDGLPEQLTPVVVGFTGYGNVSHGAQEILDLLPVEEITPNDIDAVLKNPSRRCVYKIVFKEEDMVSPISPNDDFELQDYYQHPEKYRSVFEQYVPYLSILMNCIYWDKQYPRLVTKKFLRNSLSDPDFRLRVIGDISVDIRGAIEFTEKTTSPGDPVFVYDPFSDRIRAGYSGEGVVVMAIDNLPCELPEESSQAFSRSLLPFVPDIVRADFSREFKEVNLPINIKNAMVLHHGEFTPGYRYINNFL